MVFLPRGGEERRRRLAVLVVHGSVGNYVTGRPAAGLVRARQRGLHGDVGQHPDGQLRRHLRRRADAPDAPRHRRGAGRAATARLPPHRAARLQHGGDDGHPLPGPAPAARRGGGVHPGAPRLAALRAPPAVEPLRRRPRLRGGGRARPPCASRPTTSRRSTTASSWCGAPAASATARWTARSGPTAPGGSRARAARAARRVAPARRRRHRAAGPHPGRRGRAGAHLGGRRARGPGAPGRLPERAPARRSRRPTTSSPASTRS